MHLPRYTASHTLDMQPPFQFDGMTTQVYPLRARMTALQAFVDKHVNIAPASLARFRVFAPYVHLMVLDYGRLAPAITNAGWLSQREVLFGIPLEYYRVIDGEWRFQGYSYCSPFIFVDSEISLAVGRTVMGWPKQLFTFSAGHPGIQSPRDPVTVARLSTGVFSELYTGRTLTDSVFLEVERRPAASLQFPQPPGQNWFPWSALEGSVSGVQSLIQDGQQVLSRTLATIESVVPPPWAPILRGQVPFTPDLGLETLNLKQFREAGATEEYCYQALTLGRMRFDAVRSGGLLQNDLWPSADLTGGHNVRIHRWSSLPIADTLGLIPSSSFEHAGQQVQEFQPVLPFWYEADMTYEPSRNLAWRGPSGHWHDPEGRLHHIAESQPRSTSASDPAVDKRFNTTLPQTTMTRSTEFTFRNTQMRVLPMLAKRQVLQAHLETQIGEAVRSSSSGTETLEVWGSSQSDDDAYVYMVITDYGQQIESARHAGHVRSESVLFLVPVRWWSTEQGVRHLLRVGLVPVLNLMDAQDAVTSASEVLGISTLRATIDHPANTWMQDAVGAPPSALLRVLAPVLPSVGDGQAIEERVVIQVWQGEMPALDATETLTPSIKEWGAKLNADRTRKRRMKQTHADELQLGRALAVRVLTGATPWHLFVLKQFRDAGQPERACFQSIELLPRVFDEVISLEEIETPMHVRLHEYPTIPLVSRLGLVGLKAEDSEDGVTYHVRPIRPFALQVRWRHPKPQQTAVRAGNLEWSRSAVAIGSLHDHPETPLGVGTTLGQWIDEHPLVPLSSAITEWSDQPAERSTQEHANTMAENLDPQAIVESLLSREWGCPPSRSRWGATHQEILRRVRQDESPLEARDWRQELDVLQELCFGAELTIRRRRVVDQSLRVLRTLGELLEQIKERGPAKTSIAALVEHARASFLAAGVEELSINLAVQTFCEEASTRGDGPIAPVTECYETILSQLINRMAKWSQKADYWLPESITALAQPTDEGRPQQIGGSWRVSADVSLDNEPRYD